MSDIPEDIRAATLAISLCHKGNWGCVHPDDDSCADSCENVDAIARALLAEREATEARTIERCAKVAEMVHGSLIGGNVYTGASSAEIAAAIRSQGKE